jgi:hypothetical protein
MRRLGERPQVARSSQEATDYVLKLQQHTASALRSARYDRVDCLSTGEVLVHARKVPRKCPWDDLLRPNSQEERRRQLTQEVSCYSDECQRRAED